jgi:hypothetical protein
LLRYRATSPAEHPRISCEDRAKTADEARASSAAMIEWTPPIDSVGIKCQSRPVWGNKEEPMEKSTDIAIDLAPT